MKNELSKMMSLDIFLASLNKQENALLESQISAESNKIMPLLSWDLYSDHYFDTLNSIRRTNDIQQIRTFAQQFKWKNSIDPIFANEKFEAIILTDLSQRIVWVNDGFATMTGYSRKDALDRTPSFLQGPASSKDAKERFRQKLAGIEPFKEIITNYKKNKDAYTCEVKIFPLYTEKTTHFIALEKRVG